MNFKRILGVLFFAAGVFLIVHSIQAMQKFTETRGLDQDIEDFFHHNPSAWNGIIKFFDGKPQEKLPNHDVHALVMLVSGVVLTVGGAVIVIEGKTKPKGP